MSGRAGEGQQKFTRNRIPGDDTSHEIGGHISKNLNDLGTNKYMVMGPDKAQNKE
jgi:hypothetical protein